MWFRMPTELTRQRNAVNWLARNPRFRSSSLLSNRSNSPGRRWLRWCRGTWHGERGTEGLRLFPMNYLSNVPTTLI